MNSSSRCGSFFSNQLFIKTIKSSIDYNTFVQPLVPINWFLIICAVLLVALGLFSVAMIGPYSDLNLSNAIWTTIHGFLGQGGAPFYPSKASTKIVFLLSFVIGYVLLANFSAALTSTLAARKKSFPFHDLETLYLKTDYKLLILNGTVYIDQFRYGDEWSQKFYKYRSVFEDSLGAAIEAFEREDNLALFYGDYTATNFKAHHCNYETVPTFNREIPVYLTAQKNSPYTKFINFQ